MSRYPQSFHSSVDTPSVRASEYDGGKFFKGSLQLTCIKPDVKAEAIHSRSHLPYVLAAFRGTPLGPPFGPSCDPHVSFLLRVQRLDAHAELEIV